MILTKHLNRQVCRRISVAVELRQALFTRCHIVNLHRRGLQTPLKFAAKSIHHNG